MAKAKIEMTCATCGATYTAEKHCYNRREADSWEAWMANQEGCCPACYRNAAAERRAAERDAENAAAAKRTAKLDLPALTDGTERQIAWATTIRQQALDSALVSAAGATSTQLNEQGRDMIRGLIAKMSLAATWWIDHRDDAANLVRDEIECANWARLDEATRDEKLATAQSEAAALDARDGLTRANAIKLASLRATLRYERARIAGRTYAEQREADMVAEEAAKRATLPPVPAKLSERLGKPGARWNGKFYGRDGLRVYLDGSEVSVPAEVKAAWETEWATYKAAKAAAGL